MSDPLCPFPSLEGLPLLCEKRIENGSADETRQRREGLMTAKDSIRFERQFL